MKIIISIFMFFTLVSCKQQANEVKKLRERVKFLEVQIANSYKPGFGELMGSVQVHHAKLWFAGIHENWKLAEFEIHEIIEVLENVKKYQKDRTESQFIDMMDSSLEKISTSVKNKEKESFKNSYTLLTKTCNDCHLQTKFEYNIVKIPDIQQFRNQDFSVKP